MSFLAQVSLYWLLLYGCYWLVLRRHTFFAWNRAYLLGSLLGAFALPLLPYPEVAPPVPRVVYEMATLPTEAVFVEASEFAPQSATPAAAEPFPWVAMLWLVYALGVVIMAIRLFGHLRHIRAFIRQGTCLDMDDYRLCILEKEQVGVGSFSFLNHILLNHSDYEHNFDTILSHELAHVRQRHSWDILLVEVLRVLFWFNPVLILYKKSLQQVHEYLADREVCEWEATTQRDRYAEFMVSYALKSPTAALTNPFFNSSLLKDRIVMLYKNRNSNWSLGKYAAVALLVGFVSLLAASCEQKANETSEAGESNAVADQFVIIEGTVVSTDGTPLPGAEINVKGSQTGTSTTAQGEFLIRAPAGSELDFSFEGYKPASIKMNQQGAVEVMLAEESAAQASRARRISSEIGRFEVSREVKTELLPNYVTDSVYTVVAKNPEFPGGIKAMYNFIENVMKYPASARRANVEGKVFLTFVVNSDGSIQNIQLLKGLGFACDEEAIRVVSAMPKWIPGEKANGEKVNVKYNLPISFVLPKDNKEIGKMVPSKTVKSKESSWLYEKADSLVKLQPNTSGIEYSANSKPAFRIRQVHPGVSAGKPLFVLDGIVVPKNKPDFLSTISPNNVKSVTVLHDAVALAVYGERGVNGAVEITTKQGEKMPLEIKK